MPNRSYSFKEGLAMMAAKDVGIDPYLAAEAGEDARSILAALRRAKTTKGQDKAKHIATAQTELRKLNPKQHAKLINALQAKVLALQGRGGDTAVAHLEPGEMVIPRRVLTPELLQLITAEAAKRGLDHKQLIVGGRNASINPATGTEEFGAWDTVKEWFSDNEDELDVDSIPVTATRRKEALPDQHSFVLGKALAAGQDHPNPFMSRKRNPLDETEGAPNFPGQQTYELANKMRLEPHVTKDNWQDRKPWLDEMVDYAQLPDGSDIKKQRAAEIADKSWRADNPYDPFLVNVRKQVNVNSEAPGQYPWLTNRDTHEKLFQDYDKATKEQSWQASLGEAGVGMAVELFKKSPIRSASRLARSAGAGLMVDGAFGFVDSINNKTRRDELRNSYEELYGDMPRVGRY